MVFDSSNPFGLPQSTWTQYITPTTPSVQSTYVAPTYNTSTQTYTSSSGNQMSMALKDVPMQTNIINTQLYSSITPSYTPSPINPNYIQPKTITPFTQDYVNKQQVSGLVSPELNQMVMADAAKKTITPKFTNLDQTISVNQSPTAAQTKYAFSLLGQKEKAGQDAFYSEEGRLLYEEKASNIAKQIDTQNKYSDAATLTAKDVLFSGNVVQSLTKDMANGDIVSNDTISLWKNNPEYDSSIMGPIASDNLGRILSYSKPDPNDPSTNILISSSEYLKQKPALITKDYEANIKKFNEDYGNKLTSSTFGIVDLKPILGISTMGEKFKDNIKYGIYDFLNPVVGTPISIVKNPQTQNITKEFINANKSNLDVISKYSELEQFKKQHVLDEKALNVYNKDYDKKYNDLYEKYKKYATETKSLNAEGKEVVSTEFIFDNVTDLNEFNFDKSQLDKKVLQVTGKEVSDIYNYSDTLSAKINAVYNASLENDNMIKLKEEAFLKDKKIMDYNPLEDTNTIKNVALRDTFKLYGLDSQGGLISPEKYKMDTEFYRDKGISTAGAELKYTEEYNKAHPFAIIEPYVGFESNVNLLRAAKSGIESGIQKGIDEQPYITKSLIPGYDKPYDIDIGGLKIGETSYRQGSVFVGETAASIGESFLEKNERDYYKGMDKQYNTDIFEKMKEGNIQATGQTGRMIGSVAPLVAGTVLGGTAGAGLIMASSVAGAGESKTKEEFVGNVITGAGFATLSSGISALGRYTTVAANAGKASKLAPVSTVLTLAEKGIMPAYFGASTIIEGTKSIELAREGKKEEAQAMDRGLRAMLGGSMAGAMIPGAFSANVVSTLADKYISKKFPEFSQTVYAFNKNTKLTDAQNIMNAIEMDKSSGGKYSAKLKLGKETVKNLMMNDVGIRGKLSDKQLSWLKKNYGLEVVSQREIVASSVAHGGFGKTKTTIMKNVKGATPERIAEGNVDQFYSFLQRHPEAMLFRDSKGQLYSTTYTGYETGRSSYTQSNLINDQRGILDVLQRTDIGNPKQSLFKDLTDYGKRIGTMATKTDIMTPGKLYDSIFKDQTSYIVYSKGKLYSSKPKPGESRADYISRVVNDPANAGKLITNAGELNFPGAKSWNETAAVVQGQGINIGNGKFILGTKALEIKGQRTVVNLIDTGRVTTAPLKFNKGKYEPVITLPKDKAPVLSEFKPLAKSTISIKEAQNLANAGSFMRPIKSVIYETKASASTIGKNIGIVSENAGIGIQNIGSKINTTAKNLGQITIKPSNIGKNIITGIGNVTQPKVFLDKTLRFTDDIGLTSKTYHLTAKPVELVPVTWDDVKAEKGQRFVDQMQELNKKIDTKIAADKAEIKLGKTLSKYKGEVVTNLTPAELAFQNKLANMSNLDRGLYKPTAVESKLMESALAKQAAKESGTKVLTQLEETAMKKVLQKDLDISLSPEGINKTLSSKQPALTDLQKKNIGSVLQQDLEYATQYSQLRRDVSRRLKDKSLVGTDIQYTPAEAATMKYFQKKDMELFTGEKPRTDFVGKILGKTTKASDPILRQLRIETSKKLKIPSNDNYTPGQKGTIKEFLKRDTAKSNAATAIETKLISEGLTGYQKGTSYLREAGRAIIYDDQGRILMVKDAKTGKWDFPGGGKNKRENTEFTVAREVFEETGLVPKFTKTPGKDFIGSQFKDYKGRGFVQNREILYEGKASGTLRLKKGEISDARYFTPNEILAKQNAGRTTQRIVAAKEGYSDRIFSLDPKISPYKVKPWGNPEYQQNMKVKVPTENSIPKINTSLLKSFVYSSPPKGLISDTFSQLSFTSTPYKYTSPLTSSQKQMQSNIISQLSIPSASSSKISPSSSKISSSVSSSFSPSSSSISSSISPSYSRSSSSPSSGSYPMSGFPSPFPQPGTAGPGRRPGIGRAPGKKDLIQVKSSFFRKFAFGEKDFTIDKENLAKFKQTIANKGTFFGYDSVPTEEQMKAEEARLNSSNAETKGLKGEKSIFNIRV